MCELGSGAGLGLKTLSAHWESAHAYPSATLYLLECDKNILRCLVNIC